MSAPSSSNNNSRFSRRTQLEDYYSDEDSYHNPSPQMKKPSPVRKNVTKRNSRLQRHTPAYYNDVPFEDEVDEEEVQRAMYDLGLEDRFYFDPHRGSLQHHIQPGPDFYPPPPQFLNDDGDYPYPHHLMPPPPPPPSQNRDGFLLNPWAPPPYPMMEDVPPRRSQHLRDLPFLYRSASSRLRKRNWSNQQRPTRPAQEMFMLYDESTDDEEQGPDSLPRRNSNASNKSRSSYIQKRRANSLSSAVPSQIINSPRMRSSVPYNSPGYMNRAIHSVPTSPVETSDEESDQSNEQSNYNFSRRRRPSLPRRRSDTMAPPPISQARPGLGRSRSFQGYPASNQNLPPPPPPPPPPQPMVFPQPMPHPMVERNNSMYNAAAVAAAMAAANNIDPGEFYDAHTEEGNPNPTTPGGEMGSGNRMPMWGGPRLGPNFPGFPPNSNFPQPPMPMMGMMLNPMMQGPPPPPPLPPNQMWNYMTPTHDAWQGSAEFPFPFMNDSHPELSPKANGESEAKEEDKQDTVMLPPEPRVMPIQPEPKPRRGLSFISGLFGTSQKEPPFRSRVLGREGFLSQFAPPIGSFSAPIQATSSKKDLKKAQEYEKLGAFWCWRVIPPQQQQEGAGPQPPTQLHFESFSISNQKLINRKIAKGKGSNIFLGKEKKLPGVIMIDVNQCRGCCMVNDGHFLQLELKKEQYNGNGDGNQYVFRSSGGW